MSVQAGCGHGRLAAGESGTVTPVLGGVQQALAGQRGDVAAGRRGDLAIGEHDHQLGSGQLTQDGGGPTAHLRGRCRLQLGHQRQQGPSGLGVIGKGGGEGHGFLKRRRHTTPLTATSSRPCIGSESVSLNDSGSVPRDATAS